MLETVTAIASTARLLQPLINDLYQGSKRIGARGLLKWDQRTFPQKLARRIRALEQVRTLWKPDGSIALNEFFHPPKVLIEGKPVTIHRLADLPGNAIVIEGIVGQGKSVWTRSLAIEEILSNDAKRLPVFLELKDLSAKLNLRQAIHRQLEAYDIQVDIESLDYLFKSGKIALLLDGFDEVEEMMVKETYLEIEHLCLRYPDLQVVVSSRPGNEIQKCTAFRVLRIAELVPAEFAAFLDKLKVSTEKSLAVRQAIRNSPSKISSLITTPLMLTLVVIVYEAESQIPETLPEFFERLFQLVFSRHDHLKAAFTRKHHCGLSERRLQTLFESFCFMTLQLGFSRTLTQEQFDQVFDMALSYTEDCQCDSKNFKLDITKVACLMLDDGIDNVTFLHKSILEFYAAAFVKRLNDENAKLFYDSAILKSKGWEEVLIFLKAIDPFRYARDYLLPVIGIHRDEIVAPAREADDKTFVRLMAGIYPEMGAHYRPIEGSPQKMGVRAIGSTQPRPGDQIGDFAYLILDAVSEMAPPVLELEELRSTFHAIEASTDGLGPHVPLTLLLKEYGTAELRKAVEIFATRLDRAEIDGEAIVTADEKKKLIFVKRP